MGLLYSHWSVSSHSIYRDPHQIEIPVARLPGMAVGFLLARAFLRERSYDHAGLTRCSKAASHARTLSSSVDSVLRGIWFRNGAEEYKYHDVRQGSSHNTELD